MEALDIKYWAKPRAQAELDIELKMLDKLNSSPDLQARLASVGKGLNLIEEESYDLIFMRNEYKVLMGLDSGKVPTELKDIYDELSSWARQTKGINAWWHSAPSAETSISYFIILVSQTLETV